jgi:hypothetical protein
VVKISKCAEGSRSSMMGLRMNTTTWARLFAYVTGLVNQELLLQNEYLVAENRILKARLSQAGGSPTASGPHWRKLAGA